MARSERKSEGKTLLFLMEPKIASNCLMLSEKEQNGGGGEQARPKTMETASRPSQHNSRARITFYPQQSVSVFVM